MPDTRPAILIIDKDEGIVAALTTRLDHLGYACLTAGTGTAGAALFDEHDVDLVITDLNMPMGSGLDLVRAIRAKSAVPIIVVTRFREELAVGLRGIPRITIIPKPLKAEELTELVELDTLLTGRSLPPPPPNGKSSHRSRQGVQQWPRRKS